MISENKEQPFMLEIEGFEHAVEVIHSRFDNAIDLLPDKAVIYGGALRDILAKMELKADLDILCHNNIYGKRLRQQFLNDPCWFIMNKDESALISTNEAYGLNPYEEIKIGLDTGHNPPTVTELARSIKTPTGIDNVSKYLEQIVSFGNADGVVAQVMVVKQNPLEDSMDLPLALARQVDLICCGLVMTKDGRIYEVVPDARKDCINRVLRLNPNSQIISAKRTSKRIEKLVDRGWVSAITDKDLAEAEKRAEEAAIESKLKAPTKGFVDLTAMEEVLSSPERGRLYTSHKIGTERIIGDYRPPTRDIGKRPLIRGISKGKTIHTALDALERRVAEATRYDEGSESQINAYMADPTSAVKARPDIKLKRAPSYERLSATYDRPNTTKTKPKNYEYLFTDQAIEVPNYFEQSYDPKPIIAEFGIEYDTIPEPIFVEELGKPESIEVVKQHATEPEDIN